MYLEVPIIGSGARGDQYRANLRVPKSCVIPSNPNGSPKFSSTLVWVPDRFDAEVDRRLRRIPSGEARTLVAQMDPRASVDRMEQKPRLARASSMGSLLVAGVAARTPLSRRAALIGAGLGLGSLLLPRRAAAALIFTQQASATFTGTDHAELGSAWDSGYSAGGALKLLSNAAWPATANTTSYESYNAVSLTNDQYAEVDLALAWNGSNLFGVMLRAATPPTEDYYLCQASAFTNGTVHTIEIAKQVSGAYTTLADDTAAGAWSLGDRLKGAVLGTDLYLFRNGTQLLSATDSAHSSGRAGLYLLYFTGESGNVQADNWAAGNVTEEVTASSKTLMLLGVGQ